MEQTGFQLRNTESQMLDVGCPMMNDSRCIPNAGSQKPGAKYQVPECLMSDTQFGARSQQNPGRQEEEENGIEE